MKKEVKTDIKKTVNFNDNFYNIIKKRSKSEKFKTISSFIVHIIKKYLNDVGKYEKEPPPMKMAR